MEERELTEPILDGDVGVAELSEIDQQLLGAALLIGLQILQMVEQGDEEGLMSFSGELTKSIRRNRNLRRLLEMESDDIERLLSSVSGEGSKVSEGSEASEPSEPSAPQEAESRVEVNEEAVKQFLYSPAANGRGRVQKSASLHDYFGR